METCGMSVQRGGRPSRPRAPASARLPGDGTASPDAAARARLHAEIVGLLPRLGRFAYVLSGARDEADDLVQAACLKALDRLHQYRPDTRMDRWMMRIVQTTWLDRGRARSRRRETGDEATLAALSDGGRGARAAEDALQLARVRAAMDALPEEQRAVLALVAVDGMSYREAAEALDVPVGTIMSRLARARARLAPLMEETGR